MSGPATSQGENMAPAKDSMTITDKTEKEGEIFQVSPNDDVKTLCEKIAANFNVDPAAFPLVSSDKVLCDDDAINTHRKDHFVFIFLCFSLIILLFLLI